MATETIMLSVTNTNVDPADATKVVSITGGDPNDDKEVTGTGNLTMTVDFSQDPDLDGNEHPYLVLYTWMVSTGTPDDMATPEDESMTTISVSATNEPLPLGEGMPGMMTRIAAYVDQTDHGEGRDLRNGSDDRRHHHGAVVHGDSGNRFCRRCTCCSACANHSFVR